MENEPVQITVKNLNATEGLNVRMRRRQQEFIKRNQTAEPRQRTTYMRAGRKPRVKCKRSCALDAMTKETALYKESQVVCWNRY